jgi:hypothetical protein
MVTSISTILVVELANNVSDVCDVVDGGRAQRGANFSRISRWCSGSVRGFGGWRGSSLLDFFVNHIAKRGLLVFREIIDDATVQELEQSHGKRADAFDQHVVYADSVFRC